MTTRHKTRCSTLLSIIREMKIKTTSHHLTPARVTIVKKFANNKCGQGCGEKGILEGSWLECKLVKLVRKTVWKFLKKLKIELPYDPAVLFLSIYLKRMKMVI